MVHGSFFATIAFCRCCCLPLSPAVVLSVIELFGTISRNNQSDNSSLKTDRVGLFDTEVNKSSTHLINLNKWLCIPEQLDNALYSEGQLHQG